MPNKDIPSIVCVLSDHELVWDGQWYVCHQCPIRVTGLEIDEDDTTVTDLTKNSLDDKTKVISKSPTLPQKELTQQIEEVLEEAKKTKSDNEIVQILWLIQGLDLWYRSKGKRGHSLEKVQRYVASRLLIRDSQLLDIVNQAVKAEVIKEHNKFFVMVVGNDQSKLDSNEWIKLNPRVLAKYHQDRIKALEEGK